MKKFITHSVLLLLLLGIQNTAFAATTYPYSPSEALENFETSYKPQYDQINADLHDVVKKAATWSSTTALQNFQISWADGTENGYSFQFIDVNNPLTALLYSPTLDNGFTQSEIARAPEMKYGIFHIPLRLRVLIPAIKNDKKLMPMLDSLISEKCNTSMFVSMHKTSTNKLIWDIKFQSENETTDQSLSCKTYQVSVSAERTTAPVFTTVQLKN